MSKGIEILDRDLDKVIDSPYYVAKVTYSFALESLYPLISKFELQRNTLKQSYYERLRKDIVAGCIMPAITIAFDNINLIHELSNLQEYEDIGNLILKNINSGFILDGIQRLNTLKNASIDSGFDIDRYLHINIIISNSMNKLLYRMVILNNGQRQMSARHQIEILLGRSIEELLKNENYMEYIFTEKDAIRGDRRNKLQKDALIKGFISYSTDSNEIDNQKIIEERLNEIISRKIIESNVKDSEIEFVDLVKFLIDKAESLKDINSDIYTWLNNENNIIGLFVGIKRNSNFIKIKDSEFNEFITMVEDSMRLLNPSKIKVSKERRNIVSSIVKDFSKLFNREVELEDYILDTLG